MEEASLDTLLQANVMDAFLVTFIKLAGLMGIEQIPGEEIVKCLSLCETDMIYERNFNV